MKQLLDLRLSGLVTKAKRIYNKKYRFKNLEKLKKIIDENTIKKLRKKHLNVLKNGTRKMQN